MTTDEGQTPNPDFLAMRCAQLERDLAAARARLATAEADFARAAQDRDISMRKRAELEAKLTAAEAENERLRQDDSRIVGELERTLAALSDANDAFDAVRQLSGAEYCADLAKRRMAERDTARAEADRLREAARAIIAYQTDGAPAFDEWDARFDALKAALEVHDAPTR